MFKHVSACAAAQTQGWCSAGISPETKRLPPHLLVASIDGTSTIPPLICVWYTKSYTHTHTHTQHGNAALEERRERRCRHGMNWRKCDEAREGRRCAARVLFTWRLSISIHDNASRLLLQAQYTASPSIVSLNVESEPRMVSSICAASWAIKQRTDI